MRKYIAAEDQCMIGAFFGDIGLINVLVQTCTNGKWEPVWLNSLVRIGMKRLVQVDIPKGYSSERFLFRRVIIPKILLSWRVIIPGRIVIRKFGIMNLRDEKKKKKKKPSEKLPFGLVKTSEEWPSANKKNLRNYDPSG